MAFDQSTRLRLQKFVSESRSILIEEFTRQLQASYGMDPKNGTIAELDTLTFLDNKGRQTAVILRETLAHYLVSTSGKSEKIKIKQALDRIIREQAFTVLNRLGALRMAEARGFLIESISKGYSSKGFQLYRNLAGNALGETGDAYRQYLFSLFDEFSLDLAVLFDRHSIQGRLFPRDSVLLALLEQINHFEIEHLWAEDETIGWIYQYFNSQEERKKMRAESQAPRNSRELAVRNQFFTPRYVVEFLADNTLGRIWYEMTQGKTSLIDICQYLVKRPTEVFLAKGEAAPEEVDEDNENLSQEELLKQTVYIPFRALKDPREIRMLDPACGSMHFGLYAFDIFEKIYEEAWRLETELGSDAFERTMEQEPLQNSFDSFEEFQKAIPKLIVENNIHGVDIDPRAVQIAGLSLWQRAHRTWHQIGVKPNDRPIIKKSNIVCAEPMPGEKEMLKDFTSKLNPPVLGQLVETIFDKMELAGDAGTLLKIEEEIALTINKAKDEFNKEILRRKEEEGFLPGMAPKREPTLFDFSELTDNTTFWDTAEKRILDALNEYSDKTESDEGQKRLFAEDAAKGFAFIDLCRKRFDVVLMNPPFGEVAQNSEQYVKDHYPTGNSNLFVCFVLRGGELSLKGRLGTITDATWIKKTDYKNFREYLISEFPSELISDLGWGVLDDANVSTCAYVCCKENNRQQPIFFGLREYDVANKESEFKKSVNDLNLGSPSEQMYIRKFDYFRNFEKSVFAYDAPDYYVNAFTIWDKLNGKSGIARRGYTPGNTFRFFRCIWEIPFQDMGKKWYALNNGGSYKPIIGDGLMAAKLQDPNWEEYRSLPGFRLESSDWMFSNKTACGWGKRTDFMYAYPMPRNSMFSNEGHCYFPSISEKVWSFIGYLSSALGQSLVNLITGQHKLAGYVGNIPVIDDDVTMSELGRIASEIYDTACAKGYFQENVQQFSINNYQGLSIKNIKDNILEFKEEYNSLISKIDEISFNVVNTDGLFEKNNGYCRSKSIEILNKQDSDIMSRVASLMLGVMIGRFKSSTKTVSPFSEISSDVLERLFESDVGIFTIGEPSSKGFNIEFSESFLEDPDSFPSFLEIMKNENLTTFFKEPSAFFEFHLKTHTKSRRQAPIYWPLQTPSGSYSIWVYYHCLNAQTLYTCVNDFIEPKLKNLTEDLNALRNKSTRNSAEEKDLSKLTDLEAELKDFRDELLRIAKFWKPNLNDGVQITAAPLWKLFQHRQWQKKLKDTWDKLGKGDYDWAHLACSIWPERVLRKCHEDRSLAIAHDVEDDFWEELEVPIIRRGKDSGDTKFEWHPKKLSETQLNDLIRQKIVEAK